ncbi:MAG TPA: hypothetical protein DEA08_31060, partial [Planctomycetes bacterium]|nr:hypothetical protein [Planctomycetota bacterium]
RPGLVDLSLEASAVLEVQVLGPKGQPVGANLRIDGEPFLSERDPERWAERTFAEEDEYERRPAPLQESRYLPPGETQRYTLPPGRWDLRAASANPAWAGAAAAVELAPGQKQRLLLRLQQEVPTPVRLSEDLSVSSELQLDAPAGASLVYRSARELLVRGLPPGAPARLLILRRAEDRVTLGQAELHGGQPAQLTFVAPARAAITLFEPSGELAERLEGVDLVPTRPALPATFRLKATPDDLLGHPNGWGGHAWVEEQPRELDDLAGRAMSEPDEAGRWCVERLFPGRYRVELMGWPDADFEVQLAAGQLYEVRRPLPPARD